MGALQSKLETMTAQQPPTPVTNGNAGLSVNSRPATSVQDNATWKAVAAHAFEKPDNAEAIILFAKDALPDNCGLIGKSIIQLANELARRDRVVAFAVGQGPCPQCTSPTLFWWDGNEWKKNDLPDVAAVLRAVDGYVLKNGLNSIYHLLGDKDLKVTSVSRSAKVADGTVTIGEGCSRKKNLQETMNSGAAVFWLVLILLILLVIWMLLRKKPIVVV